MGDTSLCFHVGLPVKFATSKQERCLITDKFVKKGDTTRNRKQLSEPD